MTTPREPQRIAVFRLHGLGDALLTTPAIRALRTTWPRAHITAIVGRSVAPALKDNTRVNRLIEIDESAFLRHRPLALLRLALSLRHERFDVLVLFSRSRALRTWARLTGAGAVVGLSDHRDPPNCSWQDTTYEVEQYLDLVASLGADHSDPDLELAIPASALQSARQVLGDEAASGWLALAPGGGDNAAWEMPQKRWHPRRFADLADIATQRWGLRPIVVGGPQDGVLARDIADHCQTPIEDATGVPLSTSAALISLSTLLVCNDSVAMHVGLVTGTATLAIFGPTNPRAVLPPAPQRLRVVRSPEACAPCFWQAKPDVGTSTGHGRFSCDHTGPTCIDQVELSAVIDAASDLLDHDRVASEGPP